MTQHILLGCEVLWLLLASTPLCAQLRTIPQATRDSLTNPATAKGAVAMHFDHLATDMGRMTEDQMPSVTFSWTNTGDKPLVITRITTTCGCVTASYDKQPVPPKGEGRVSVTYHPKGHPGGFAQRLFVYTQLSDKNPSAILRITGVVEVPDDSAAGYPIAMGALRLSRGAVTFDGKGGEQQANIACRNAGSTMLQVGCDRGLQPSEFSFSCEPEVLQPGAEGILAIHYKPTAGITPLPERIPLFLTGLGLSPSKSTIRIQIDNK